MNLNLPLNTFEYLNIHDSISEVLAKNSARLDASCVYYAHAGAAILKEFFDTKAAVRSGIAAYALSGEDVLYFADRDKSGIGCSLHGFHCWLEADGWLIDFMAPKFVDMYNASSGKSISYRLNVQIPQSAIADHPSALNKRGDVCVLHVPDFSIELSRHVKVNDKIITDAVNVQKLKMS